MEAELDLTKTVNTPAPRSPRGRTSIVRRLGCWPGLTETYWIERG